MKIRAYNLIPGAVVKISSVGIGHLSVGVVGSVVRDGDLEIVAGRYRTGTPFVFTYEQEVELVGLTVNPDDADDQDFGTDESDRIVRIEEV